MSLKPIGMAAKSSLPSPPNSETSPVAAGNVPGGIDSLAGMSDINAIELQIDLATQLINDLIDIVRGIGDRYLGSCPDTDEPKATGRPGAVAYRVGDAFGGLYGRIYTLGYAVSRFSRLV